MERWIACIQQRLTQIQLRDSQLTIAKESAENADQTKSRFLTIINHEIRTAMNAILGFAEILKSQQINSHHLEYTTAILNSGDRVLRVMNDILELSKVTAGKLPIRPVDCHLSRLCSELAQIFEYRLQEKKLQFTLNITEQVPEWIVVDEVRLRQILLNVVGNAVKFTEQGMITLTVDYQIDYNQLSQGTGTLRIIVQDSGIGIPQSAFQRIFEAFEPHELQNAYSGLGLGLAITRQVVQLMGGQIMIQSQVGVGSTFSIELPGVLNKNFLNRKHHKKQHAPRGLHHFAPATILVVDDEQLNLRLLRSLLQGQPLSILEASNGSVAIKLAREFHPALVLMDMKMPVMNGFEACHILKEDPVTRHIPIIAVTALSEDDIAHMLELYDAYLPKPINKADLIRFMRRFLPLLPATQAEEKKTPLRNAIPPTSLKDKIVRQLLPAWQRLGDPTTTSINHIENFAFLTRRFAQQENYQPLLAWAEQLQQYSDLVDIAAIHHLLAQFRQWIENICPTDNIASAQCYPVKSVKGNE